MDSLFLSQPLTVKKTIRKMIHSLSQQSVSLFARPALLLFLSFSLHSRLNLLLRAAPPMESRNSLKALSNFPPTLKGESSVSFLSSASSRRILPPLPSIVLRFAISTPRNRLPSLPLLPTKKTQNITKQLMNQGAVPNRKLNRTGISGLVQGGRSDDSEEVSVDGKGGESSYGLRKRFGIKCFSHTALLSIRSLLSNIYSI